MTCAIDGCAKAAASRGWCHAHYRKWRLHGTPHHGRSYVRAQGEGTVNHSGYIAVTVDGRRRMQHVIVAEKALGKPLPPGAVVHHVDRNRQNNDPSNLVVCPDQAYHKLIHLREDAMRACGNPNYRRCLFCREYDDPASMTLTGNNKNGHYQYHKPCRAKAEYERTHK